MNSRFPTEAERTKRTALLELLSEGMVMLHLDTRSPGVDVPEHLRGTEALALNLSHAFRLDLFEVGPYEIVANLSFGDLRYRCVLPWKSIFSMTQHATGERRVYVEDFPPELLASIKREAGPEKQEAPVDAEASIDLAEDRSDSPASDAGTPHLRLV
jgi:stringent starvation protein B